MDLVDTFSSQLFNNSLFDIALSDEQNKFIQKALTGKNILVDACIGSGKTTAIQYLCQAFPSTLSILYLTYNKLLKVDARKKILNSNVTVTNYHGFAFSVLTKNHIESSIQDLIINFNKIKPEIPHYDVLVIDEYQDIETESAEMLNYIKESNPQMQIIAVGDMEQKIYDKTTLDVSKFIDIFLGDYVKMQFTLCFRLSEEYASKLGRIWKKTITGVNTHCIIDTLSFDDTVTLLALSDPGDVLCLGSRSTNSSNGLTKALNILETYYPEKYNKKTVFASIMDNDSFSNITPKSDSAIFTTYDSSKGLERKICIVFDYTENYWFSRLHKPFQKYEILRNIFCVAASRGKEKIIFVKSDDKELSEETLINNDQKTRKGFPPFWISEMFDFKYREDIEACYSKLEVNDLRYDDNMGDIYIKSSDEMIDLSPCIGIYQEATFFNSHSIDYYINEKERVTSFLLERGIDENDFRNLSLNEKVLFLVSAETGQIRYRKQVNIPFVSPKQDREIHERLQNVFSRDEIVQKKCELDFSPYPIKAYGICDVIKNNIVYELKFVSELSHEHFLQCACYVISLGLPQGILWNTRTGQMYQIKVPDVESFKESVRKTILKGLHVDKRLDFDRNNSFFSPASSNIKKKNSSDNSEIESSIKRQNNKAPEYNSISQKNIAVIDTETNWNDDVMSIGIVIADSTTLEIKNYGHYIIEPEYNVGGMYAKQAFIPTPKHPVIFDRIDAINEILALLNDYNVTDLFAYNAKFDFNHLPELSLPTLIWHDIMGIAAYKQYNKFIPQNTVLCNNGRIKKGFRVEDIIRMFPGKESYLEKHNALLDAIDELEIIKKLGLEIGVYDEAIIGSNATPKRISTTLARDNFVTNNSIINSKENQHDNCEDKTVPSDEKNIVNEPKINESDIPKYSVTEICQVTGLPRSKIYNYINSGLICPPKIGNKYLISENEFSLIMEKVNFEKLILKIALISIGVIFAFLILYIIFLLGQ